MIKYYSYYSFGGYTDMFIGTISEKYEHKFYIPLLPIYEEQLKEKEDNELHIKVAKLKQLPQIISLSEQTSEFNYPSSIRRMISHSGYKVMYRRIDGEKMVLSVRDIVGQKDNVGREAPFSFIILSDTVEDIKKTDIIAEYLKKDIKDFENNISTKFSYDPIVNGLSFNLAEFNTYINKILSIDSINPEFDNDKSIRLLMIAPSENIKHSAEIQKVSLYDISYASDTSGHIINLPSPRFCGNIKEDEYFLEQDITHKHLIPSLNKDNKIKILEDRIKDLEDKIKTLEEKIKNQEKEINKILNNIEK